MTDPKDFQALVDAEMNSLQLITHNVWELRERMEEWRKDQAKGASVIYGSTLFMYINMVEEELK